MKHATLVLVVLVAAGCDRARGPVDPTSKVEIRVEARDAVGEEPKHVALTAPVQDHDTWVVMSALQAKAHDLCGEGRIGTILESPLTADAGTDPLVMRFTCMAAPLPGRVDIAADADVPEQPALAPGQSRQVSWGTSRGMGQREPFESLLGRRMRDIYVDACGERGVHIDRMATYVQPLPDESGVVNDLVRSHLVIDYRCATGGGTDAASAP